MKNTKFAITLLFAIFFSVASISCERHEKIIVDRNNLPATAQSFLSEHFSNVEISVIIKDKDLLDKEYKVYFTNGNSVEFDKKGEWTEVECRNGGVPSAIVPQKIREYVEGRFSGQTVVEINKDRRDYEIELSNGLELKFDLQFNLIEIDD